MRKVVDTILHKYGTEVILQRKSGDVSLRCFFQPVNSTSWLSVEHAVSPLGHTTHGEYVCIASAETEMREGEILLYQNRYYVARRVESYCYCGQAVYQWVLCLEKGGADTWGA